MNSTRPNDAASRLTRDTRLECKICWYLYDPAVGDETQQIPAGTPFLALPDYWRCPQCDADPNSFLPIEG